ncbi:MAG: AAA family ATPase [Candidatus Bathyarchaeia archaeon]
MDKPTTLNISFAQNNRKGASLTIKPKHRIGITYVPGALPCFEDFGNLPTDIVRQDGLIDGKPASEILDMIIIPGGSLVESQSVNNGVAHEILRMAESGKFVLGVCAGFQVLAKKTDVGRLSSVPILREGLGLLDVEFKPLICTDRVKATVVGKSYITSEGGEVTGFHCHTYGKIDLGNEAKPILVSHVSRLNYHKANQDIVSGVSNKSGNIVGVLVHALLDQNQIIKKSILQALDVSEEELGKIKMANSKLVQAIKNEIGISTQNIAPTTTKKMQKPSFLLITALGSGSGKTFLVTGIAGALKKRGFNVGVLKIGGDIRDSVPALYLIKEPIKDYSSIKIGESGWTQVSVAIREAAANYNLVLIEGAMSAFTGLLNDTVEKPSSTVEVAVATRASTILVANCEKEGIEGTLIAAANYLRVMKNLGVNVKGVILNKMRLSYSTSELMVLLKRTFEGFGTTLLGVVPRLELEGRGLIPEIEIKYDEFGAKAMEVAERFVNLDAMIRAAEPVANISDNYKETSGKFKNLLDDFNFKMIKGEN